MTSKKIKEAFSFNYFYKNSKKKNESFNAIDLSLILRSMLFSFPVHVAAFAAIGVSTKEVKPGIFLDESLTLLKHINIPILLIEGPFQNNPEELLLLNESLLIFKNTNEVQGRIKQLVLGISNIL